MATDIGPVTATSATLVRLLTAGPSRISLDGDVIRLGHDAGIPVEAVDGIATRRSWLWTRMAIRTAEAGERSIGGLRRDAAARLAEAVSEEAVCVAERMSTVLIELDERLARFHAADRYRRDSRSRALQEEIANAVHRVRGKLARSHLPPDTAGALSRIEPLASEEAFEAAREEANSRYVSGCAPAVARAASGVLSAPPTEEQATAIATEEDATLVLAGAGTGKTAVITGKVAHLVRNRGVPPREILVLAFNRKAAEEIRERLAGDLAGAHVHTFHSFGRRVIADVGVAPTVSKLAEDDARLVAAIRPDPPRPARRSRAERRGRDLHRPPPRRLPLAVRLRDAGRVPPLRPPLQPAGAERRPGQEHPTPGGRAVQRATNRGGPSGGVWYAARRDDRAEAGESLVPMCPFKSMVREPCDCITGDVPSGRSRSVECRSGRGSLRSHAHAVGEGARGWRHEARVPGAPTERGAIRRYCPRRCPG